MYGQIAAHTPVSRAYATRLVEAGVLDEARLAALEAAIAVRLDQAHQHARDADLAEGDEAPGGMWQGFEWAGDDWSADTRVPENILRGIAAAAARLPQT